MSSVFDNVFLLVYVFILFGFVLFDVCYVLVVVCDDVLFDLYILVVFGFGILLMLVDDFCWL